MWVVYPVITFLFLHQGKFKKWLITPSSHPFLLLQLRLLNVTFATCKKITRTNASRLWLRATSVKTDVSRKSNGEVSFSNKLFKVRILTSFLTGTPYWAPSGEKQYYISKRCASKSVCTMQTAAVTNRCDRIWFNDWECVECCHGDRCNFYVTLSAHTALPSTSSIIIALLISTILPYLYAVQK